MPWPARRSAMDMPATTERQIIITGHLSEHVALALLLGAFAIVWSAIIYFWPISFWRTQNDYVYLTMSHALSLESSLRDGSMYPDQGLATHPGIPFYFVSWICMKLAALAAGHRDSIEFITANPDGFFITTRLFAGGITALAIVATWYQLRFLPVAFRCVAIMAFYAADANAFAYGLTMLSNETFAWPLLALLFWGLQRIACSNGFAMRSWVGLGAIAAAAYSVKLLYLDIAVACGAAAVIDTLYRSPPRKMATGLAVRIAGLASGVAIVLVLMFYPLFRWEGLVKLFRLHFSIALQDPGAGSGWIETAHQAFSFFSSTPILFLECCTLVSVLIVFWGRWRNGNVSEEFVLPTVSLVIALLFATLSISKRIDYYYLLAIGAIFPFLLAPALAVPKLRWAVAALVAYCVVYSATGMRTTLDYQLRLARDMAEDEAAIFAMPLSPGEARLWTYKIPDRGFALAFVAWYSGVPRLMQQLRKTGDAEFSSFEGVERPYRYIVLDRSIFRSEQDVRQAKGSLEPTQALKVYLESTDQIETLKRTIIVRRRPQE